MDNIRRHKILMDREVTLANITDAVTARSRAFEEYEMNRSFREQQKLEFFKTSLSPKLYDQELERITETRCDDTGHWLDDEKHFRDWSDPAGRSTPLLWLSGIPGAGNLQSYGG